MTTGKVISYDPDKGDGMIQPDGQDHTLPFDTDSLTDASLKAHLHEGDRVRFEVVGGLAGVMCTEVERIDA